MTRQPPEVLHDDLFRSWFGCSPECLGHRCLFLIEDDQDPVFSRDSKTLHRGFCGSYEVRRNQRGQFYAL